MAVGEEGCDTVKLRSPVYHLRKTSPFHLRVSQLPPLSASGTLSHANTADANHQEQHKKQCKECTTSEAAVVLLEAFQTEVKGGAG